MKNYSCKCKECRCKQCLCGPYAMFFDTLGNESRLVIINSLRKEPKNVNEIVSLTRIEQTAVSHALKKLAEGGFVTKEKRGRFRVYTLNKTTVEPLMKLIDRHVKKYCVTEQTCGCGK